MKTLTLNLPDSVDIGQKEASMILASKLYEIGKLSLAQAAESVGASKQMFIEWLENNGITIYDIKEKMNDDTRMAKRYFRL